MSRPKPEILLEVIEPKSYMKHQILEAYNIYAIYYDGKPINVRQISGLTDLSMPKYIRTSFSNPGTAFSITSKLNKLHKTDKFDVYKLEKGEKILK